MANFLMKRLDAAEREYSERVREESARRRAALKELADEHDRRQARIRADYCMAVRATGVCAPDCDKPGCAASKAAP